MKWERVREVHAAAADGLLAAAEQMPGEAWFAPLAAGKWSPAQVMEHLNLTYDVLTRELEGGEGMRVITKAWQRFLLRIVLVPRILRGGPFPEAARAPREIRPSERGLERGEALDAFRQRRARFEAAAEKARAEADRLTHAYFGRSTVARGVLLCARHIQHHQKQLAR
jgi:hypothetical protein